MSLSRWQPLREMLTLRDTMDQLFDDSLFRQPAGSLQADPRALPMDLVERDNELIVRASVPGFDPSEIDISLQGDTLTLSGSTEQREGEEDEEGTYHLREYRVQRFQRTLRLPATVDVEKASADCKNGVLTIHLPKSEESSVKRISVNNGQQRIGAGKQVDAAAK